MKVTSANPRIMELPIASGTAILDGQAVGFTVGVGVISYASAVDADDPIFGIAMEAHDGATAGRQSGTKIKIAVPPVGMVFKSIAPTITATGGSTTTFVDSNLVPATDDIWIGGYIQVVTCAADATMIGKRIPITDSTGATGTLTFATQKAAFAAGDTAKLCPGLLALTIHTWDLDSTNSRIDYETAAVGEALRLVDADPANMTAYFQLRLNHFADYDRAI